MTLSADKFYQLRDDRTNQLVETRDYHRLRVRLVADAGTIHTFNGQVQLLITSNMLARWCRKVEFGFQDAPLLPVLQQTAVHTLHERILSEVRGADPFGSFSFSASRSSDTQYTLKVGGGRVDEDVDFSICSDGWLAYAGQGNRMFVHDRLQDNLAASAFSACIGVADAFKVAVDLTSHLRVSETVISLLDFETGRSARTKTYPLTPETLDLGNTQLIGVGSVGSAVVYLLAMLSLKGNIDLVDHDLVEYVNLNRSPLFSFRDIDRYKVEVGLQHLTSKIPTRAYSNRYDEYIEKYGRHVGAVDLMLSLANEHGVRSIIEHNLPPLQIYGTTTSDWGINYHRHIPLREDCSMCRFPVYEPQLQLVCSESKIAVGQERQTDAALPFLSVAAAALTIADLMKLQLPAYPFTGNFAFVDFKGPLEFIATCQKPAQKACACATLSDSIHRAYIDSTRFAELSASAFHEH